MPLQRCSVAHRFANVWDRGSLLMRDRIFVAAPGPFSRETEHGWTEPPGAVSARPHHKEDIDDGNTVSRARDQKG